MEQTEGELITHFELGPEFARKLLAETDIELCRDRHQGADGLAAVTK